MMRRPTQFTIGEDVGSDDDVPVDEGAEVQDWDKSIYVGIDPDDPDSEVPQRHARKMEERAASLGSETDDPLPRLMQAFSKLCAPPTPTEVTPERVAARARLSERRVALRARVFDSAEAHRDGHAKTVEREVVDLPLSAIAGTRVENIRLEEDETAFKDLCESLNRDGQLQPIVVVAHIRRPDHYQPVAGFRRLRAAAELGWPTIRAVVCPAGSSDQELFFLNAIENAQRFKLSDYEVACRAQLMATRFGTPLADYARRLGRSPARIQNLVRFLERLPPDIVAAWRAGDPLLNDHMLQKLAAMPHDEASELWTSWKARCTAAPRGGARDRSRPRRSMERPTSAAVSRLWVAVKRNTDLDDRTREVVLKVVEYCLGHSATIPGLFDPRRGSAPARIGSKS